jgi:outer membrane protein assembly factor BamB
VKIEAAAAPEHAVGLLRDLTVAALQVLEGRQDKVLVPFSERPWELCLRAGDGALLVSAWCTGSDPEVRALDREVAPVAFVQGLRDALGALEDAREDTGEAALRALLERAAEACARPLRAPARAAPRVARWSSADPEEALSVGFTATVEASVRRSVRAGLHADLHALLVPGEVHLGLRGHAVSLGAGYVVLQLERLLALCRPLLEAWGSRRPLHLRARVGQCLLGMRLDAQGRLCVTASGPQGAAVTVPALDPRALTDAVARATLALARELVLGDRAQGRNLRLRALSAEARGLRRWLRALDAPGCVVNPDPALYRAAVTAVEAPSPADLGAAARLRYVERWRVEVEGLDLSGTLLCGDRLVVPGTRELSAIDRATGACRWTFPVTARASTTLAGEDLLRVSARGDVELRSVATGEVLWATKIVPRVGASARAHAVAAPGLPRMVVLPEGERRLVALDLRTGEPRWAYTSRHGGMFRFRRAGRLLLVTAGEPSVVALDLLSGEVVWRYGDRVPFHAAPVLHGDLCLCVASERGRAAVHALGAYTGARAWVAEAQAQACAPTVVAGDTAGLLVASREGISLLGIDVETGQRRFECSLGVLVGGAGQRPAATAFDDTIVASLPTGRVLAVSARDGTTRWVRAFRAPVADDVPRRLDPQLRAGALFVPQSALAVLRPRDGSTLADVDTCDLVPDLVRVDEQCALYVGEESGHLGCFELGARLRVLRPV